ncbi:MAG: hypothetical protein HY741_06055 [Chloroflexi bacterium]|nr:hypothetical protein [Chloroflexota bacterium]
MEADPRLEIIGATSDLARAREMIEQLKPDILILDEALFPLQVGQFKLEARLTPPPTLVTLYESDDWMRIHRITGRVLGNPNELVDTLVE